MLHLYLFFLFINGRVKVLKLFHNILLQSIFLTGILKYCRCVGYQTINLTSTLI